MPWKIRNISIFLVSQYVNENKTQTSGFWVAIWCIKQSVSTRSPWTSWYSIPWSMHCMCAVMLAFQLGLELGQHPHQANTKPSYVLLMHFLQMALCLILRKCKRGVFTLIYSINVPVHTLDPFSPHNKMEFLPGMLIAGHLKEEPTLLYRLPQYQCKQNLTTSALQ